MNIKKFLKSQKAKLLLMSLCIVSLLSTSGVSFAKYYSENYSEDNATLAQFGSWNVQYSTTPINMPDNAPTGYYAYVASFKVSFTEGEVNREYTLKIKTASNDTVANSFDTTSAYTKANFYYPETTTIYTTTKNSEGAIVATSSGVASSLTNNQMNSFSPNNIYMAVREGNVSFEDSENKSLVWEVMSLNTIFDNTTNSLNIHSDHTINAQEQDFHIYNIIFFYNHTYNASLVDFKFIYSLNVRQVM